MPTEVLQVNFRMPAALKARLEEAALANRRTLTAEIIDRLEVSLSRPPPEEDFWNKEFVARLVNEMADELDRRGAKMMTVRKKFEDYDPKEARKKAIEEGKSKRRVPSHAKSEKDRG